MNKTNDTLDGKRYINLVRCSSAKQADTSIPDQLKLLNSFAVARGMVHVADEILDGVTGSIPGARSDIERLIRRKKEVDDFDVLLVQDSSRLTRGGATHGMKIEYDLASAGIRLVFAAGAVPDGKYGAILQTFSYFTAQEHAQAISFASTRGSQSALEQGRIAHCSRPPYGVDRLYLSAAGVELHVIRTLPDGTQQKLDPKTGELLLTFGRNDGKGRSRHYVKQKDEHVILIPGAPERVEAVRLMFRRHLFDGWGYFRIAAELNASKVASPTGRLWNTSAVGAILGNPIYTGASIANRMTMAIYNRRSRGQPAPAEVDPQELANRKRPAERVRPRSEWMERGEPRLAEYLDAEIRALAQTKQQARLEAQAAGRKAAVIRDRHTESEYILKGIIVALQGELAMSGRTTGSGKYRTRYYAVTRAYNTPSAEMPSRRFVRAEAVEQAVFGVLREVLSQAPQLRGIVRAELQRRYDDCVIDGESVDALMARRGELKKAMEFVIGSLGKLGQELARKKAMEIEAEAKALGERIVKAMAVAASKAAPDIDADAAQVIKGMQRMLRSIDKLRPAPLRRLLRLLVPRVEVDLETLGVQIDVALPLWAALNEKALRESLCLDAKSPWQSANEAQNAHSLELAVFRCSSTPRPFCLACRRLHRAA
ncbi:MAG TPA: recombinase family protein [Tepidisphaeraceae bacterium]|nr:recombinase family protein [Tepidisphaeraceae bacterium]